MYTKIPSDNFSFCVSEFLENRYNISIDEHICYILGSSLCLNLLTRKDNVILTKKPNLANIKDYYIECNNPLAIENFSSNINSVFRIDHNDNLKDLKWIASDYINLNNIKTLVLVSSNILLDGESCKNMKPLYAITYFPNLSNLDINYKLLKEKYIAVSFMKNVSILIKGKEFIKYWKLRNNEIFNANRYVIIPPIFTDFDKNLSQIIKNSLIRQYYFLTGSDGWAGPKLIKKLIENINESNSNDCLISHINLLRNSFQKNSVFPSNDMDRLYASESFRILNEKGIIKNKKIINELKKCGNSWIALHNESLSQNCKKESVLKLYVEIYNNESAVANSLKKIISSWI